MSMRLATRSTRLSALWLLCWFGASITMGTYVLLSDTAISAHHLPLAFASAAQVPPLGADAFGRNLLVLGLSAAWISAIFALVATLISIVGGLFCGTAIALAPPRLQTFLLRGVDTFLAFPSILLALGWAAISGPGLSTLIVALTLGSLPNFTRFVYARSMELLNEEYVTAAFAAGATRTRVLFKHLTPALKSLCSIKLPGLFAGALLGEATLSFLGVGVPVGRDSWGSLLTQSQQYLIEYPHISIAVGIPLVFTLLSLQTLADGLSKQRNAH